MAGVGERERCLKELDSKFGVLTTRIIGISVLPGFSVFCFSVSASIGSDFDPISSWLV